MLRKNKRRFFLSFLLLTLYGGAMGVAGMSSRFDPIPLMSAWFVLTPIVAYFLGMTWQFDLVLRVQEKETVAKSSEKRKREAIDDVLRDLSDADLVRLKHRLENGTVDDDVLYEHMVGDDGELVDRL